jgi:uncharacterized protein
MRGFIVRVCFAAILLASPAFSAISASAQSDATPVGVDGTSYTSPSFGYQVSWSDDWQVVEDESDGGYDLLHLANDQSDIYFEGYVGDSGDPAKCLDSSSAQLSDNGDPSTLTLALDADGTPIAGEAEGENYAVYAIPSDTGNDADAYYASVDCIAIQAGVSVLAITSFIPHDSFQEQSDAVTAVTDSLTIPAQPGQMDASDLDGFETAVENDLNAFWTSTFASEGKTYDPPKFVTFDGPISTGCGDVVPEDIGPFYCPEDSTVYLDQVMLTNDMLPYGQFIIAVVIAHEVGHHIQNLLGLEGCSDKGCGNRGGSLAVELQADCFAGVWSKDAGSRGNVQAGDIEETVVATAAFFGDPPGTSATDPDAHGPGALRTWWFLKGYYDGIDDCIAGDTGGG